jgi:hypothetical protein
VAERWLHTFFFCADSQLPSLSRYNPDPGKESCSLCPDGQYTAFPGSATCVSCFGGYFLNTHKTECVECDAGKASDPGATTCTECTAGKFAAAGASYCATAEAGEEVGTRAKRSQRMVLVQRQDGCLRGKL